MTLEERLAELWRQSDSFRIIGGAGVTAEGSMQHGYAIEVQREEEAGVAGIPTGACCVDTDCSITTEVDCAGIYQGDGTSCDPNPCVTPTGACCHSDNTTCSIETESDCDGMGGTYQGDDASCDPNPCPCPSITLVCDSISAARTKCGFPACDFNGKLYLTRTESATWSGSLSITNPGDIPGVDPDVTITESISGSLEKISQFSEEDCTETDNPATGTLSFSTTCSGASDAGTYGGSTTLMSNKFTDPHAFCTGTCCNTSFNFLQSCNPYGATGGSIDCDESGTNAVGSQTWNYSGAGTNCVHGGGSGLTQNYSLALTDEYTTALLISNTEAALPAYDDDFNDLCSASRDLSDDETGYSISRFKYKFTFPAATIAFTISWNEHTVFEDTSTSDTPRSEAILIGQTESTIYEVLEPATDGTITIIDIVCTPD